MNIFRVTFAILGVISFLLFSTSAFSQDNRYLYRSEQKKKSIGQEINNKQIQPRGCNALGRSELGQPRIELTEQGKGFGRSSSSIKGFLEGVCLTEAGIYENGRLSEKIKVESIPTFKRFPFNVTPAPGKNRELRVYNTQGGIDTYEIPDLTHEDDPLGFGLSRPDDEETLDEEEDPDNDDEGY